MPQSLSNVVVHLVFSTKHRAPTLPQPLRKEVHAYLGGVLRNHNCNPIEIGGVEDHVHILLGLSRTMTIAQVTEKVKTSTTKWIKTKGDPEFSWQSGYGAFSVGIREVEQMSAYIRNQEAHHRTISFQDEFRALLQEAGLEFDERYVWD